MISGNGVNVHYEPGLFDQCIGSSSPSGRIRGEYCSVYLRAEPLLMAQHSTLNTDGSLNVINGPKITLATRQIHFEVPVIADAIIGFCQPSSCSAEDLRTAVANKIGRTAFLKKNKNGTAILHSIVTSNHDQLCYSQIKNQEHAVCDTTCIAFM